MNENIDLTKILKDCHMGFELYSPLFGTVKLNGISNGRIVVVDNDGLGAYFNKLGQYISTYEVLNECVLFPSKDQRDWSKFTAPWYKKDKFDPKTLKAFDKVLVRNYNHEYWCCGFFSYISMFKGIIYKYVTDSAYWKCIPYNDDTKHLVGTVDEAPEYYRYWEE